MVKRINTKGSNDEVKMKLVKELGLLNLTFLVDMKVKDMINWLRGESYIDYASQDINSVYEYVKHEGYSKGIRKVRRSIRGDKGVLLKGKTEYQEYVLSQLDNVRVYRVEFDDNYLVQPRKEVKVVSSKGKSRIKYLIERYKEYKVKRYNEGLDRYKYRVKLYIVVREDKEEEIRK